MKTFSRHLWYLSEELVGIAFFDNSLDVSEKRLMVKALEKPGCANPSVRPKIDVENVMRYRVSDFVTLSSDPQTWSSREDYITARNLVKSLKVVNDVAERGLATATDFNGQFTTNEEQWQHMILGVDHNRKLCPNSNKKTVLKCLT